jgi:biotin operon repressor
MYDRRGVDGKRAFSVGEIAAKLKCSRPTVSAAIESQRAKQNPI